MRKELSVRSAQLSHPVSLFEDKASVSDITIAPVPRILLALGSYSRTATYDLGGGVRRGKGAMVTSHTALGAHFVTDPLEWDFYSSPQGKGK